MLHDIYHGIAPSRMTSQALLPFHVVLFTVLCAARWVSFFDGARRIFGHSVVSSWAGDGEAQVQTFADAYLAIAAWFVLAMVMVPLLPEVVPPGARPFGIDIDGQMPAGGVKP
jgi:hypothetical protein